MKLSPPSLLLRDSMNRFTGLVLFAVLCLDAAVCAANPFDSRARPFFETYCFACHDADEQKSGVRLDVLTDKFADKDLQLWSHIRDQIADESMPPDDQPQPNESLRGEIVDWIDKELTVAKSRVAENNGSVRRLTVEQYRNTLQQLLGIQEDLTVGLPPDAVSKDGFTNNTAAMVISPLQVESYFDIAAKALDQCIVDPNERPTIQNFRVDFGKQINPQPCPDNLILGAGSHLLASDDFVVHEMAPEKPFEFNPFAMRTKYRFHEGYQGNSTVRGWKEYDSIYHAVFACLRGPRGDYPKGLGHEVISDGLLLRPAIPSRELFGVGSVYGPKPNFKIALRELPSHGNFRITVTAAKYDDGLLLDVECPPRDASSDKAIVVDPATTQVVNLQHAGVYQIDVHQQDDSEPLVEADGSRLQQDLMGRWTFDESAAGLAGDQTQLPGAFVGNAQQAKSPFGQSLRGKDADDAAVYPRTDAMNVAEGDFSVAAWIHPDKLARGGIVGLGKYGQTHGWYFDMPDNAGALRIETAGPDNQSNGSVTSYAGVIRANTWQHVAAVVRRGESTTRLFVNGFEVATGTIGDAQLDNPNADLHIGRIQSANSFQGQIDEVHLYRRALSRAEIQALVEPGRQFAKPPAKDQSQVFALQLGDRSFTGRLNNPAFLAVRLPAGSLDVSVDNPGQTPAERLVFTQLDQRDEVAAQFAKFEAQIPRVGVHVGLRRDCGHTFRQVGEPQNSPSTDLLTYTFEGAINDYPRPDVQADNDNYLAGVREIAVRSEYTDGRDMPRLLIQRIEFEGPLVEQWPPATHQRIFIRSGNESDHPVYAREIIRSFATNAFRRPVRADEEEWLMEVWRNSYESEPNFRQSIKDTLTVVLTSPQFLHLIEESSSPKHEDINDYELASKLAYFLWNGPPDEILLELAQNGTLRPELDHQLDRMMMSPHFRRFANEFTTQWLGMKKIDTVEFDIKKYPDLRQETITALQREPAELLLHLIRTNSPVRELVQSEQMVVNEITAQYYSVEKPINSGFDFVPVAHGSGNLGGLLSQAGILAGLSDGRESNPVKRGAWLARKIVGEPPEDPPPNVPALADDLTNLSLRERLERHRNQKGCVKCHLGIDPWGVPLEEFDAAGLFKNNAVDAKSTLPDNTQVASAAELKAYLAEERLDQVAFSFLKHLATYATGRDLGFNEIASLRRESLALRDQNYAMRELFRYIINSDLFLKK